MGSTGHLSSTGYGPSTLPLRNSLMFTGKEENYDIWVTRFLGYMAIKDLKKTILPSTSEADTGKNEKAYAELVLWLDETSLSIIMNDAKDRGRDALRLLRDQYRGSGKPRILIT